MINIYDEDEQGLINIIYEEKYRKDTKWIDYLVKIPFYEFKLGNIILFDDDKNIINDFFKKAKEGNYTIRSIFSNDEIPNYIPFKYLSIDNSNYLHYAAKNGAYYLFELLNKTYESFPKNMNSYEIINQQNFEGNTPLHEIASTNFINVTYIMIEMGANKRIQNNDEDTPYDIALRKTNNYMINLLKYNECYNEFDPIDQEEIDNLTDEEKGKLVIIGKNCYKPEIIYKYIQRKLLLQLQPDDPITKEPISFQKIEEIIMKAQGTFIKNDIIFTNTAKLIINKFKLLREEDILLQEKTGLLNILYTIYLKRNNIKIILLKKEFDLNYDFIGFNKKINEIWESLKKQKYITIKDLKNLIK